MLIDFSVSNFRSINTATRLSMIASKERRHGDRLTACGPLRSRLLPIATIHGANAAGKSNLLRALSLGRYLVIHATQPKEQLPYSPYRLDATTRQSDTELRFRVLVDNTVCVYTLRYRAEGFSYERLDVVDVRKRDKVTVLFERTGLDIAVQSLTRNSFELQAFSFIKAPLSNNTPLLRLLAQNPLSPEKTPYSWTDLIGGLFSWFERMQFVIPDVDVLAKSPEEMKVAANLIHIFDTGVQDMLLRSISLSEIGLPPDFLASIRERLSENSVIQGDVGNRRGMIILKKEQGELHAYVPRTIHKDSCGNSVEFDFGDESDGTVRLMTLLSRIYRTLCSDGPSLLVIDEIERSLHSSVIRKLISDFLAVAGQFTKSQLILSTHDDTLFDADELRRDEQWVATRTIGGTTLECLGDKALRYDLTLMNRYRKGDFGGIAHFADKNYAKVALEINGNRTQDSE